MSPIDSDADSKGDKNKCNEWNKEKNLRTKSSVDNDSESVLKFTRGANSTESKFAIIEFSETTESNCNQSNFNWIDLR